jgi:hypothetical protein
MFNKNENVHGLKFFNGKVYYKDASLPVISVGGKCYADLPEVGKFEYGSLVAVCKYNISVPISQWVYIKPMYHDNNPNNVEFDNVYYAFSQPVECLSGVHFIKYYLTDNLGPPIEESVDENVLNCWNNSLD